METLEPAPNEFVVHDAAGTRLVRTGATDARAGWRAAAEGLDADARILPVLRDRDGVAHYPTGEVTVRFAAAPSDAALRDFARDHGLRLARRNEIEPRQAVFEPEATREWLPDVVERLARSRGVERAWANTLSRYQRT